MPSDSLQCAERGETRESSGLEQANALHERDILPAALAATSERDLELLRRTQEKHLTLPQVPIITEHVLHAGMYSRTITMPPGTRLIGALIRIPTLVITVGSGRVYIGGNWQRVRGYQVIPGREGRKQAFYSEGALIITMIFRTSARTVEEAEREFTPEHELLLSRRQDMNTVLITEDEA